MVYHFTAIVESTRCVAIEGTHQDGTADFLSCSMEARTVIRPPRQGHSTNESELLNTWDMYRIEPHPSHRAAIDRAVALTVELLGEPPVPSVRDLRCSQMNSQTKSTD